jgi:hypothetical protein
MFTFPPKGRGLAGCRTAYSLLWIFFWYFGLLLVTTLYVYRFWRMGIVFGLLHVPRMSATDL